MDLLDAKTRDYDWGTSDAIAELQGRPVPAPGPEAELWMGAHPTAPSGVRRLPSSATPPTALAPPVTLDTLIAADPQGELGPEVTARFGGRLPFLLKVLSAARALSIQVHPSRAQAEAGYADENARRVPLGDPARNYVDDWPKPELLYALTPFEVAAGLRTPADASALLQALEVDELKPLAAGLTDLGAALATVLRWREPAPLVASVVAACQRLAGSGGPYADACAAAVRVAAERPGDIGVVALLLMRHAVLQPGQAMFMPAGGLHAYLRGTGIELLANSDNVVRSGLTSKHIDVPELLKLVDPAVEVPILTPRVLPDGITCFAAPVPEFRLHVIELTGPELALPGAPALARPGAPTLARPGAPALARPGAPALARPGAAPRILLCLGGSCTLRAATGQELTLTRGGSCFIPFADGPVHATGHARLIQATPGDPTT
jgi:mannose-6-phosphate isomerase